MRFKKERENPDVKRGITFFLYALTFIIAALFYMWPHHQMIKRGYEYQELRAKHEKLFQENRILKLEMASVRSLDRIEKTAVKKGFILPQKGQIVFLKDKNKHGKINR